jgi:hypothetical protein
MGADLVLLRGEAGESLTKTNVRAAAVAVSRRSPLKLALADDADCLLVRLRLAVDDEACASIAIRFSRNGRSLSGTARGRGEPLLHWCFHALARQMRGEIDDPQGAARVTHPDPAQHERKARRVVQEHETEVLAERADPGEDDDAGDGHDDGEQLEGTVLDLIAMMLDEGTIALAESDRRPAEGLLRLEPLMDDPSALYEAILEADEIDEVFVSESEFVDVVRRFRLRAGAA